MMMTNVPTRRQPMATAIIPTVDNQSMAIKSL